MNNWRWIDDGAQDGVKNMATDLALLKSCEKNIAGPTLRFYKWSQPTISIGNFQKVENDLDLSQCVQKNILVVRRPTGGRAILHSDEVTYSVAAPNSHPDFSKGIKQTHFIISQALISGLKELGVCDAGIKYKTKCDNTGNQDRSPACFSTLNHCEIAVRGKKLIGSAQKRTRKAFLQHGSILLGFNSEELSTLLKFKNEKMRDDFNIKLNNSITALNHLGISVFTYHQVLKAILKGFQKIFPGDWKEGSLSNDEKAIVNKSFEKWNETFPVEAII